MESLYSEKDEINAKTFVMQRIVAENNADLEIRRKIREAIEKITEIAYRYKISPLLFRFSANKNLERQVDEVIRELKEFILEATLQQAYIDGDVDEETNEFVLSPYKGKTFRQRIAIYCERFKYEIEAGIAAALIMGRRKKYAANHIYKFIRMPYSNPDIITAIERGSASATRLVTGGVSYGVGHTNVMYNAISLLAKHTVSEARMRWFYREKRRNGAFAFMVKRGSTFPCALCDEQTTYLHIEGDPLPPFHPHCVCIAIPVYL